MLAPPSQQKMQMDKLRAQISIQNMMGQQFYSGQRILSAGMNTWNMNLKLPMGHYYIIIRSEPNITSQQFRIE